MRHSAALTAVYTLAAAALAGLAPVHATPPKTTAAARAVAAPAPALSAADQAFLDARDAARAGNRVRLAQLASQLTTHPLSAYVEYWQLAPSLRVDPAASTEVEAFLTRHANTYIADRLRLDWALALADRGDFSGFDREAALLVWNTDDSQLRCYAALSRYRVASGSQADVAARDARQLLANTRDSAGEGCLALTEALLADGRISVW
jgi:soluble lytic murein transglycosylase